MLPRCAAATLKHTTTSRHGLTSNFNRTITTLTAKQTSNQAAAVHSNSRYGRHLTRPAARHFANFTEPDFFNSDGDRESNLVVVLDMDECLIHSRFHSQNIDYRQFESRYVCVCVLSLAHYDSYIRPFSSCKAQQHAAPFQHRFGQIRKSPKNRNPKIETSPTSPQNKRAALRNCG